LNSARAARAAVPGAAVTFGKQISNSEHSTQAGL